MFPEFCFLRHRLSEPVELETPECILDLDTMAQPQQHKGGYKQINKALNICAFEDYLSAQLKHLPRLEDVEQLSPRVIRVLGQNAGKVRGLRDTNAVFG